MTVLSLFIWFNKQLFLKKEKKSSSISMSYFSRLFFLLNLKVLIGCFNVENLEKEE